jgi:predicted acetyltransferase
MKGKIMLEAVSLIPPKNALEVLKDLGNGESGFGGTAVGRGEQSLEEFLVQCVDLENAKTLPEHLVPQTTYWILDSSRAAVGLLRLRHFLNPHLLHRGGHIGYYICTVQRGQGYAKKALREALGFLAHFGEKRALLTVDSSNHASLQVVRACGGQLEDERVDEDGVAFGRFWIQL